MTYGWALVAVIVISGLIWIYVGGRECGKASTGFLGQNIGLQDWTSYDNGTLALSVKNTAPNDVWILEITGSQGTDDIDDVKVPKGSAPVKITTKDKIGREGDAGNCYKEDTLTIKYNVAGGIGHLVAGKISGNLEESESSGGGPPPPPPAGECSDLIDNDNDGLTDYPGDPGCADSSDNTETDPTLVCDNGLDESNDADALADFRLSGGDLGCTSATDSSEVDGECDDLSDNDLDTHTDFNDDSKCISYSDSSESPKDSCGDTDNGIDESVQGTVSGDDNDVPFSNTDFCIDSATLNEYSCEDISNDYNPLSSTITCGIGEQCTNGACIVSAPPADIIVSNAVLGQTTKYIGVTEGARFVINDIVNSGAKSYRIWYGMDRIMNSGGNYNDFVPPFGSPDISQIKSKLVNWPMQKAALESLINIATIDAYMKADMWGQGASFNQQISQLTSNGIVPVITLRNHDGNGAPTGSPRVPFDQNDWDEYYYYVFAVVYWTNVYANGGSGYNVERWEVHNEPQFDFGGTPAQYTEFVNYTYDAVTDANNLKSVTTKLMAAVDVADNGGYNYLTKTLDDEGAIYSYNLGYVDYHNYMRWKDDKTAADEVFNIMDIRNKVKPMWVSEWGTYDGVPAWYTSYTMAMNVVSAIFRLSQLQKEDPTKKLEGSSIFIMDGQWGSFQGIVQNNVKTPTYHGFHLQTRCLQDAKDFYQLSKDDDFVLVAKDTNNVYINSVNYGKTFTIDISALGKSSGTYDLYIFDQTQQDILIKDNEPFDHSSGNYIGITVPSNGAICAIAT